MKNSDNCIKQSDIFTGTIKRCNDIDFYNKYGESRYIPDYRICSIEVGTIRSCFDVIDKYALLIKVDEDNYVRVESLDGFFEMFFANRGIYFRTIGTRPHFYDDYYVDEETVVPYFKSSENEKITVKTLKKLK